MTKNKDLGSNETQARVLYGAKFGKKTIFDSFFSIIVKDNDLFIYLYSITKN
jgi:hypothetical protein